jgi:hypothetical protein
MIQNEFGFPLPASTFSSCVATRSPVSALAIELDRKTGKRPAVAGAFAATAVRQRAGT